MSDMNWIESAKEALKNGLIIGGFTPLTVILVRMLWKALVSLWNGA